MPNLNKALDELIHLQQFWQVNQSPVWGQSTGYPSIDKVTGGLHKGEVSILAARTSHGKTALATKIAFNVAEDVLMESVQEGETTGQVLIFSPEMTDVQLMMRQACMMSEVPSNRLRTGKASEEEVAAFLEAVETIRLLDSVLTIKATGSVDVHDLSAQVETRHAAGPPVRLVVVDYLQRLSAGARSGAYDKASEISFTIKDMANRQNIPVLLLSQLNRSPEKRKNSDDPEAQYPELSDLRDSGRIEEDADSVWLLWRPNKMSAHEEDDNEAQQGFLRIAKNRNGAVAGIPIWFYPRITLFRDAGVDRVEMDGGS